ncbi:hypothetical protein L1D14_23025 [Vibrio tubiashii]|uniref:hypothetical protein n=1 Tax=Vibrio tubiashii TaxID=29498 RepID=UPI001EFDCE3E|nr:hypothetical protein [Vibrio tubiashii]MCG9579078.1 hypothetical protein [Vibrio tubiashii]
MAKHYLINPQNHYIVVDGPISVETMFHCTFYKSLDELYDAASKRIGLDLGAIEGNEIKIVYVSTGLWEEREAHNCCSEIECLQEKGISIEQYINDLVL